ncbi:hypothetical protein ACVBEF_18455 [Glaciimonas sp. GG7]
MKIGSISSLNRTHTQNSNSNHQEPSRALTHTIIKVTNVPRIGLSWEAEHIITRDEKLRNTPMTHPRLYTKNDHCHKTRGATLNPSKCSPIKKKMRLARHPLVDRSNRSEGPQISKRSASKYDTQVIGLLAPQAMKERISRYIENTILPNFIHDFFCKKNDPKFQAFQHHPEQFPATRFSNSGGMLLMPNPNYLEGRTDSIAEPLSIIEKTRSSAGFALVGYWIPPGVFEKSEAFTMLFGLTSDTETNIGTTRETVAEYNKRMNMQFIVNSIDVKKHHLPMLKEFKEMSLKHLQEVYGFRPRQDKVNMYLHGPIYGNQTAGLHVHIRVNQRLPAGESDISRLSFDKLLKILEDDTIAENDVQNSILSAFPKTASGQYISYTALNKEDFHNIPVTFVPNPWKRP